MPDGDEEYLMEENIYAPPKAVVADAGWIKNDVDVRFFAVSPVKLVVLSVCTLGLYQIYWFYKHWVLIKRRSEPLIIPWARAFFGFFWCYSCFEFIRNDERRLGVEPTLPSGPLAIGWIAVSLSRPIMMRMRDSLSGTGWRLWEAGSSLG
jgi:hypothetical protein